MKLMLITLWVLSGADLYFTLWAHTYTPFVEGNPVARSLLGQNAYGAVISLKLASVLTGTWVFWKIRRYARAEVGMWMIMIVMFSLTLTWGRYTTMATSEAQWIELASNPDRFAVMPDTTLSQVLLDEH